MAGWFGRARRALSRWVSGKPRPGPREGRIKPGAITPSVPFERSFSEKMTAGWLAQTDPDTMLGNLSAPSPRKLRLFGVACCRPLANLVTGEWCRQGLALA